MPSHLPGESQGATMPPDVITFIAQRDGPAAAMELVQELITLDKLRLGLIPPEAQSSVQEKLQNIVRKHFPHFDAFYGLSGGPNATMPLLLKGEYAPGAAPVYHLPVELLARILALVVHLSDEWPFNHSRRGPRSSMTVRSVCQRWRTVAEATPVLWTNLPNIYGSTWASRIIEWSGNAPLDVTLFDPVDHDIQTREKAAQMREANALILAELPRIRLLDALVPKIVDHPIWSRLTAHPGLALEVLNLRGREETHKLYPDDLFGGVPPPHLHTLKLSFASLSATHPVFRSPLTHLKLNSCYAFTTANEVLSVLSGLPSLESFIMRAGWATGNDRFDLTPLPHVGPNSFAPRSVKLPHLRELTLREPLPIMMAIFAHLEVPPSAQLELRGFYRDVSDNSLANSLRDLDEALGPHMLSAYSNVATDGFTTLKLKAFDNVGDTGFDVVFEGAPSSSSSGPGRFVFGTMGQFMQLFGRVLSWPPMTAHVRRLELSHADSDVPEGAQIWEHLLLGFRGKRG